jgi:UDP-N-acetylmuramate--alanine ligase
MTIPGIPRRLHFLGIRGQGLSALAGLALERGHQITACDRQAGYSRYDLLHEMAERLPAAIEVGNDPAHVTSGAVEGLVVASYVPDEHPEILAARAAGLPVLRREELLGLLLDGHRTLAVAGVAGKSTTTAMAVHAARGLGLAPLTFVAAYDPNRQGHNYSLGNGRSAIVEACEFRRAFLRFRRDVAIVTNLHWGEHIDYYASTSDMLDAFTEFASSAGHVVVPGDADQAVAPLLAALPTRLPVTQVGFDEGNDVRIERRAFQGRSQVARVTGALGCTELKLGVPGRHNLANAVMAAAGVHMWDGSIGLAEAVRSLADFRTLGRRLEPLAGDRYPIVVDDYGHHPVHLRIAAETIREAYPRRRLAIYFEPSIHRRVALLRQEYVDALASFDRVLLAEIVVGTNDRPEDVTTVSSSVVAADLRKRGVDAAVATPADVLADRRAYLGGVDVFLVCGARRAGGLARRFAAAVDAGE